MLLHGLPLFRIERTALVQDSFRHADFADVVSNARKTDLVDFGLRQAERFGKQRRIGGDLQRVPLREMILRVDR